MARPPMSTVNDRRRTGRHGGNACLWIERVAWAGGIAGGGREGEEGRAAAVGPRGVAVKRTISGVATGYQVVVLP